MHIFDLKSAKMHYSVPSEPLGSTQSHRVNIPLTLHFSSNSDAFLVAYANSNLIAVHSLISKSLHPWSIENSFQNASKEYRNRYNRITGVIERSPTKFVFYTHYTWFVLDLSQDLPVEWQNDHEQGAKKAHQLVLGKQAKALDASSTWFSCLKESQRKYVQTMLRGQAIQRNIE